MAHLSLAFAALSLVLQVGALAQPGGAGPEVHAAAPEIHLASYVSAPPGAPDSLAALRGKVVVLEFWATWCGPCVAAIPHLNELAEKFAKEPVVFISISRDEREPLEKFLAKHPMKSWVALEGEGRPTSQAYGVGSIPHAVVIDAAGKIAAVTQPTEVTEGALRDVLAGRPIDLSRKIDRAADLDWDREGGPLEEGNPAAIAHVILQHSDATGTASQHKPGSGRFSGDGLPWQVLVHLAYDAAPEQMSAAEIPALKGRLFRVSVRARDDDTARRMLRDVLASVLGLKAEWKQEEREVLVLARAAGAPEPRRSEGPAGISMARHGRIIRSKAPMSLLAQDLGAFAGDAIGVDETKLDGEYDVKLTWTPGDEASLGAALAAYGLEVRKERREVAILHARVEEAGK